jgi:hypothetical protein
MVHLTREPVIEPKGASFWQIALGADAPPALRELRAGPVTAFLDGIELRYLRLGDVEIVRRVYVAVRDPVWATVPGVVGDVVAKESGNSFEVSFDVAHNAGELEFAWHGLLTGDTQGLVRISMSGRAGRELVYNRIGICVLLPPNLAGRPLRAHGPGDTWRGWLPEDIGHQRNENGVLLGLHPAAERLEVDLNGGQTLVLDFAGDLFETEDQRNWTDASFKIYSTPLALGLPRRSNAGALIEQRVAVQVASTGIASGEVPPLRLELGEATGKLVPKVGLGFASPPPSHSHEQLVLLTALSPAHIRLDCHVEAPSWESELREAVSVCEAVGAELELALFCRPGFASLDQLADALAGVPVARLLVFFEGAVTGSKQETTPDELVALVRGRFDNLFPIVAGTDLNFCELNRTRPDLDEVDGLAWPMSPQVHAFDDASIVETPEAQAAQVATARHFAPGKSLFIGPVTLLPRYNPSVAIDRGPSPADGRQATLLAAAFTLSSLKHLSEAGVDAVTYYETVGERGIIGEPSDPASDAKRGAFPLFHVLADASGLSGAEVLVVKSSRPLAVVGVAARQGNETSLLVANTTPTSLTVELAGVRDVARIRRLNVSTAHGAGREPLLFRAEAAAYQGGTLELGPYETVRIDFGS